MMRTLVCFGRHCAHDFRCWTVVQPVPMPTIPPSWTPTPKCTCGQFYHSVIPPFCPVHNVSTLTVTCGTLSAKPVHQQQAPVYLMHEAINRRD